MIPWYMEWSDGEIGIVLNQETVVNSQYLFKEPPPTPAGTSEKQIKTSQCYISF